MPQWWKRPRVWLYALLTMFVVATAGWVWFLSSEGRGKADQWSSIAGPGLAAVAVLSPLLVWLWRQGAPVPDAGDLVINAVKGLVQAQYEQWTAEQAARQVHDPYPLPVRWQVSDRAKAVMASWAAVRGQPGGGPVPVEGSFDEIAVVFTGPESPRRLVVLGEPGAGKSMLVLRLTVDLLTAAREEIRQDRELVDPVPVLLSISGWDPQQPLLEWIAVRLATDNPPLRRPVTGPDGVERSLAAELVATGRVLPILDGLDEITDTRHPAALAGVEAMAGQMRQFVLTCRTDPHETAVHDHGPVAGTPVVEVQPLTTGEVGRYLIEGTDGGHDRWARVIKHMRTQKDSPVAQALATPLYTWLARVVYRQRRTRPDELLDADWASTSEGIEKHLLGQLIHAVFTTTIGGHRARTATETTAAHQYLTFFAGHLHRRNTYDLAWWQLHQAIPNWQLGLVVGLVFGLAGGLVVGLAGGLAGVLAFGLAAGLVGGLVFGLVFGYTAQSDPQKIEIQASGLVAGLVGGLVFGLGLVLGIEGEFVFLLAGVLVVVVWAGFVGAADDRQRAISPTTLLSEDRAATLVVGLAVGLVFGLAGGLMSGLAVGLVVGLAGGLVSGLVVGLAVEWKRFLLARVLLAMHGRTPLRLMTFLQEAHDRGVLRQSGGVYQFRHARLQDLLAHTKRS